MAKTYRSKNITKSEDQGMRSRSEVAVQARAQTGGGPMGGTVNQRERRSRGASRAEGRAAARRYNSGDRDF